MVARAALAMELEVNSEAVETVEVVAGAEDGATATLIGQQLMVTNAQDLIASPEV